MGSVLNAWWKGATDWHRARLSYVQRAGTRPVGRIWSTLVAPLRKSIRARFRFAMALALIGIILIAAIALASNLFLLGMFERSVSEMGQEIAPSHVLETSLREAERLGSLYVTDRDASASAKFNEVADKVERQFQGILEYIAERAPDRHAGDHARLLRALVAWRQARDFARAAFQFPAETRDAADAVSRMVMSIDPAYRAISEFHHHAMEEVAEHLELGHNLVRWVHYATIVTIVFGLGLLALTAALFSRSILEPVARLLEGAGRLARNDLSYRVRLRNDKDELGYLGIALNSAASSLQRLYQELERRGTHDGLTGVANRTTFEERLAVECKSADRHKRPLSLLMLDIDFFKRVNDTYGHQVGDRVLQNIAQVLNKTTRPGDVVARYGGEEFSIILPGTDADQAMLIAQRICAAVEKCPLEGPACKNISVTASLGCATRTTHALSPAELVQLADQSLYLAKQQGRNRVVPACELSSTRPCEFRQTTAA